MLALLCALALRVAGAGMHRTPWVEAEDFGAKADNQTLSSEGINAALKHASSAGGGIVHVRGRGTYRVGRIELQSNTVLKIGPKTLLHASDNKKHWTSRTVQVPAKCGGAGLVQNATRGGVFFALRAHNFSIGGGGTVNGGGAVWNNDFEMRTHFLEFFFCSDVVVEDLTITNSSSWTLRPSFSKRLIFRRLTILGDTTGANHHNTDGFDPWASQDVEFRDSYYEAGESPGFRQPERNILVDNITCAYAHGLTIGSEVSGGIRNVTFSNIRVHHGQPVKMKTTCGRGAYVRDVLYENITGTDVDGGAVWISMQYHESTGDCPKNKTTIFENVVVRNVHVNKATDAYTIVGLGIIAPRRRPGGSSDASIRGLVMENVTVAEYTNRGECAHADVTAKHVSPKLPSCK
ncbi:pectin lyase fold/virulence factor [Pelagophyceae sp. CCMP2097]|nr:pectin lyase fold/virulence factor [Pelagophyceae sp. CCMP2097]